MTPEEMEKAIEDLRRITQALREQIQELEDSHCLGCWQRLMEARRKKNG